MDNKKMIDFYQALKIVLDTKIDVKTEYVELNNATGRILAQDIFSDINMPPFDKAAMDGYACRKTDLFNELDVVEIIQAGKNPEKNIGENQAAKIMTGAKMPAGADTIFIVEDSEILSNNKVIYTKPKPQTDSCNLETGNDTEKSNICYIGEDIKTGDKLLNIGTLLKPQHIAVLATVGCINPKVYKMPDVAVIATGSELVEPHLKPVDSQIRNSNASQMISQIKSISLNPKYYGIAPDNIEQTTKILKKAVSENDIIMLSGGVSEGDFDFVPQILENFGFKIIFDRIAVQPGKPTTFAVTQNKICFGMPGNPVSSFVQFQILFKPFIFKLLNANNAQKLFNMPLSQNFNRKSANRMLLIPAKINEDGTVCPTEYHGSAHINALSFADALIEIPVGVKSINKGEKVYVRQI